MFNVLKNIYSACSDTMRFYKTVQELTQLTDKELQELGMHRSEIPMVAMNASIRTK